MSSSFSGMIGISAANGGNSLDSEERYLQKLGDAKNRRKTKFPDKDDSWGT